MKFFMRQDDSSASDDGNPMEQVIILEDLPTQEHRDENDLIINGGE